MAFTFSHAVVAPYLYRLTGQHFPLMPLVIGTMLPDITRVVFPSPIAHHFSGMFSINLVCGGLLCLLWFWLYRPVLFRYAHWELPQPLAKNQYFLFSLMSIFALLLGNFSHLFWDSFTHLDDRTWFGHDVLAQEIQFLETKFELHQVLQFGTSLIILPWLYFGFKPFIPQKKSPLTLNTSHQKSIKLHLFTAMALCCLTAISSLFYFNFINQLSIYGCLVQSLKYTCLTGFGYLTLFCLSHSGDLDA